jgi:hypothetical protein
VETKRTILRGEVLMEALKAEGLREVSDMLAEEIASLSFTLDGDFLEGLRNVLKKLDGETSQIEKGWSVVWDLISEPQTVEV